MKSESEYRQIADELKKKLKDVRLMAVSKTRTVEEIDAVFKSGIRLFGENRVQEIVEKFSSYRPQGLELHMIGHLQTNKVAKVVPLVDMIQSIDSFKLLEKVDAESKKINRTMPVLLEYNTSGEQTKSGFDSEELLFDCIEKALDLKNVEIRGLMTVGPLAKEDTRAAFRYLNELKTKCINRFKGLEKRFTILSMGMSGDWETAVEEGSTLVRLGTAIFGERTYV